MKSRLKNLGKYLIEHGKQEFKDWNDIYREFYDQIRQIRKHVNAGESLLESIIFFCDNSSTASVTGSLLAPGL